MKIELHLIQSFPPSCLNRDATGSPKDCEFGGARRARVSSQCFKRAMRGFFREENQELVGERTKRLRGELLPKLGDLTSDSEILNASVDAFIHAFYSKNDSKKAEHAAVLLFLSQAEINEIAQLVRENWDELQKAGAARLKKQKEIDAKSGKSKKSGDVESDETDADEAAATAGGGDGKYKDLPPVKFDNKTEKSIVERLKNAAISSDIGLFGRMLAEHPEHKIEAACQVAHAISTHAVTPELDFFSAVDDLNTDDAGAGMLGVTGFNAAVFYRYALVDFDALKKNLGDDNEAACKTARAFLEAFIQAIPTGKQNSMGAQNRPDLGFFVVREAGMPCSLVNAFCTPVRLKQDKDTKEIHGLLDQSVERLANYWEKMTQVYGNEGVIVQPFFSAVAPDLTTPLGTAVSKQAAIEAVMGALPCSA